MTTPHDGAPGRPASESTLILAICLFLLAIYLVTAVPYPRGLDEMSVMAVGRSLQGHLGFDVDTLSWTSPISNSDAIVNGPDGHAYTPKDLTPSLIAAPFIKLAFLTGVSPIHAAHLSNLLASLLAVVMVYLVAREWGYSRPARVLGALAYGLCTQAWPYATSLMTQTCASLGLIVAVWGASRAQRDRRWQDVVVAGLGMSLAGLSVTTIWSAAPIFVAYLAAWEEIRRSGWRGMIRSSLPPVIAFCAAAGAGLLAAGVYNTARFGSPFDIGQRQAGNIDFSLAYFPVGGFGMLFGAPTGLVWFTPLVLLTPFGAVIAFQAGRGRQTLLLLGLVAALIGLYGSYFIWWSNTLWGPRYLVPTMPAMALLALPLIDLIARRAGPLWVRAATGAVLALSAATQMAVTLLDYSYVSPIIPKLLNRYMPPASFAVEAPFLTNLRLTPQAQAVSLASQGTWAVLWAVGGRLDWPVFAASVVLIGLGGLWLWVALRRPASRILRPGLIAQGALSLVFAGALLARYPHAIVPSHPVPPRLPGIDQAVDRIRREARPGDGIVLLLYPTASFAWHDYYDSSISDVGLTIQPALDENARIKLERLPQWRDRVWLVSDATAGGNPDNAVERALAQTAFIGQETWYENWRVVPYTFGKGDAPLVESGAQFGEQGITLKRFSIPPFSEWGRGINVRLEWQTSQPLSADYTVFVHLLDGSGRVLSQHDGPPGAGYWPTSRWEPGQTIDDRHSLIFPPDLLEGEYRLTVGLYDPSTGARLMVAGQDVDALTLTEFTLPPGP